MNACTSKCSVSLYRFLIRSRERKKRRNVQQNVVMMILRYDTHRKYLTSVRASRILVMWRLRQTERSKSRTIFETFWPKKLWQKRAKFSSDIFQ